MNARLVSLAMLGIASAGTLAGCAAADAATPNGGDVIDATDGAASFADGDYAASGQYFAPSGQETVEVSLTLTGGTVTALTVTGDATDPTAKQYQQRFVSGIDALVVGKPIADLDVTNVAGSSLTSGGFDAAISQIITQAQS